MDSSRAIIDEKDFALLQSMSKLKSQLPAFRVQEDYAFASVGIDFAGPLCVKSSSSKTEKAYIALFRCAASRAVHLEMVTDLKTETFLLCFKRFVSRRGLPVLVVTDNSKTFKAFSKPLQATMKSSVVLSYLAERGIKWKFNLSKALWWGGFYERLIKGVKTCLKISIGRASLLYDKLHTIIVEMEGVLNSRQLKYQYPEDLEQPLTPSHLLTGRRLLQLPMPSSEHKDQDFEETRDIFWKRATNITRVLEQWWKRWKRDYLLNVTIFYLLNSIF